MRWFARRQRDLPWRKTRDPYRIWIAEVMLQQTRVAVVSPYYEKFLKRFPDVHTLAAASEEEVLRCWSGLGYYSRARNLHRAAQLISAEGAFPRDYDSLRALPGVGDYTAAAVASIAFGEPRPALDANALRVLSRLTREPGNLAAAATRTRLHQTACRLLDPGDPGGFNQALMELGATVCLPRNPACASCPIASYCRARRDGVQHSLPSKPAAAKRTLLRRTLLVIERGGALLLGQFKDRLTGLWGLPESEQLPHAELGHKIGVFRHSMTRFDYLFTLVTARVRRNPRGFCWVAVKQVQNLPLAASTRKALVLYSRCRPDEADETPTRN